MILCCKNPLPIFLLLHLPLILSATSIFSSGRRIKKKSIGSGIDLNVKETVVTWKSAEGFRSGILSLVRRAINGWNCASPQWVSHILGRFPAPFHVAEVELQSRNVAQAHIEIVRSGTEEFPAATTKCGQSDCIPSPFATRHLISQLGLLPLSFAP